MVSSTCSGTADIHVQSSTVEVVDEFCYLSSYISQNGNCEKDVKVRIEKVSAIFDKIKKVWRNKHINLQTKLRLYEALILTTVLYGAEVWSLRHIEQVTGSSTPQVTERHSWYHLEGQSNKWRSSEKNRTNICWENNPRKKDAMAWSYHENGWSTHSEASTALGSCGIQEKTWQTKDELERCNKEGPPKNGINLRRGWSISSRQTLVASTCGPMHRWCWINQVKLVLGQMSQIIPTSQRQNSAGQHTCRENWSPYESTRVRISAGNQCTWYQGPMASVNNFRSARSNNLSVIGHPFNDCDAINKSFVDIATDPTYNR